MSLHEISGRLHDGDTSRSRRATLRVYADGTVRLAVDGGERTLGIADLDVPARLGNTPRRIGLPDGSEFETEENAAVDALLDAHGPPRHDWLHRMENRLGAVVVATLCVLAAGALFVWRGVPLVAREVAFAVSPEVSAQIGRGTLDLLDRSFEVSGLPETRREELRARLQEMVRDAPEAYDFELVFRGGGSFGANAFALPSGTVIVTDELVQLAENDGELVAVLAHEVGHVVHRHGLRSAIQSSMLLLAIVIVTGDLSSTSSVVAALPTLLAEASFSRDFEREADDFALVYLRDAGIPPRRFADLLRRLEAEDGGIPIPFIASHPTTEERIERLEEAGAEDGGPSP